jgi:hypothetical protein
MRLTRLEECGRRIPNPPFGLACRNGQKQRPSPPPINLGQGSQRRIANHRVRIGGEARQSSSREPATSSCQRPRHGATNIGVAVMQQAGEAPGDPLAPDIAQGAGGAGTDVAVRRTHGRQQARNIHERGQGVDTLGPRPGVCVPEPPANLFARPPVDHLLRPIPWSHISLPTVSMRGGPAQEHLPNSAVLPVNAAARDRLRRCLGMRALGWSLSLVAQQALDGTPLALSQKALPLRAPSCRHGGVIRRFPLPSAAA